MERSARVCRGFSLVFQNASFQELYFEEEDNSAVLSSANKSYKNRSEPNFIEVLGKLSVPEKRGNFGNLAITNQEIPNNIIVQNLPLCTRFLNLQYLCLAVFVVLFFI